MSSNNRVLIVDDENSIRISLADELEDEGYSVTTAASGEEAFTILKENDFDLIITDLIMEGIGGIEVLKKAKTLDPVISVLILTGYGNLETAIAALRLGADDYLLKPCEIDELLLRVKRGLEKREMQKKIALYENIIPVCAGCKKIRDDDGREPGSGEWLQMEAYIIRKTGVQPSHGLCPECAEKMRAELDSIGK
ncbi:MAG: response regulator [Pseudomonadota bacterium]|nr:response regulator [Pseudomonadota bacterium]